MNKPSSHRVFSWFDPRGREPGSFAFILNRFTGLALTFYLILHLIVLNKLTKGSQAYDDFVMFAHQPLIKLGEILLIAAVVLHGLNGLRIIFLSLGLGLRYQKAFFILSLISAALVIVFFATRLFGK